MSEKQFDEIVNHQVRLMLQERGIRPIDLSPAELFQYKYKVALMLLCELGGEK